jgi:hypothetical protein
MTLPRSILFAFFGLLLAACASDDYGADDFAAELACEAREQRCVEQCLAANPYGGDSIPDCEMKCRPSGETVCY